MGRKEFSSLEAEKIRYLLQRKVRADRAEQKVIRASIRRLGFYISDYTSSTDGFTSSDFDSLIEQGEIVITGQHSPKVASIPARPLGTNPRIVSSLLPLLDIQAKQKSPLSQTIDFESLDGIKRYGFSGFIPVSRLQATGCADVPKVPGVYLILRVEKEKPVFLTKSKGGFFKGSDPTVSAKELHENWVVGPIVLNIGKAGGGGGKATLRSRLKQYMEFGAGKPVGHRGGRYIWQLVDSGKLKVCWLPTLSEEPKSVEARLIQMFKSKYGKRPFANLQD